VVALEEVVEEIWKLARLEMAIVDVVVVRNSSHLPPPVIHEEK
jgi:hypothetical protein